ncbi:MAG: hypothetical protein U0133_16100 [Gemmatimonadales bacterium]
MDLWSSRLKDHDIWPTLTELGQALDVASQRDGIEPTTREGLARLKTVLTFVGKRLSAADPHVVLLGTVDAVRNSMREALSAVKAFTDSGEPANVQNANAYADGGLASLASMVTPAGMEDFQGLREALTDLREVMGRGARDAHASALAFIGEIERLRGQVGDLESRLETERQTLAGVTAQFQGQFSDAQSERQKAFAQLRDEIREDLQEELQEFKTSRERHTVAQEVSISEIRKDFVEKAAGLLTEIEGKRNEVNSLVEATAQRGIASDFLDAAGQAKESKWLWQRATVLALLLLIVTGWAIFLGPIKLEEMTWPAVAARFVLMGATAVLAGFTAAQAERYQEAERRYRQRGMEMATLGPFMSKLPGAEQDKLRVRVGELSFGKDPGAYGGKAPTSILGLVLLNRELNRTVREFLRVMGGKTKT